MVLKFSKGKDNLDKLLESQRMSFNKEGIGYNSFKKKKTYKNFLFKRHLKMNLKLYATIVQERAIYLIYVLLENQM